MTTLIAMLGGFLAGLLFPGVRLGKQSGFLGYLLGGVTVAVVTGIAGNTLHYLHHYIKF